MPRKLVVALPAFTDAHRSKIAAAAKEHGFEVEFYPDASSALAHVGDAEIIVSNDASPAK